MSTIIEHVVLFRAKDDAAKSEIDSMVERVNSLLVSIKEPLHLTMGPLIRIRSSPPSISLTSILHSRFNSKDDLHAYAVHPTHVAVINANVHLVADTMAHDWVAAESHGVPLPGSALRVTFFKLKEGVGEKVKDEVLGAIRGTQQHEQAIEFTCGENFSPGRAKGFSIASLVVFQGLSEMEAADSDVEIGKYIHKDGRIKEHLESVLVLDYVAVVPSSKAQPAS